MKTLKRKVKVGGFVYDVSVVDEFTIGKPDIEDRFWARTDFETLEIQVKDNLCDQRMEESLLHELIHAIADLSGLEIEEEIVLRLSSGLYQSLKDNFGFDPWEPAGIRNGEKNGEG